MLNNFYNILLTTGFLAIAGTLMTQNDWENELVFNMNKEPAHATFTSSEDCIESLYWNKFSNKSFMAQLPYSTMA